MKTLRLKKVLGLAIGERSLLVAEVVATGDRPDVRQLGELMYPAGVSLDRPDELGRALSQFLREKRITAQAAVVGLPAKSTVASPKELPAAAASADAATRASILRLQAEAEFSTELKDLVFDYVDAGRAPVGETQSVLLMATPQRYVDAAVAMCRAARLTAIAVTPTAIALGEATSRLLPSASDALVMSVGASGAELTAQSDTSPSAIRHLRSPASHAMFVSELRRAVSTMPRSPGSGGAPRELIVWDGAGIDRAALESQAGVSIRGGELSALGVGTTAGMAQNGAGRAYGPAVALALVALRGEPLSIDFLHSRLTPPKIHRVPRWAYLLAGVAVVLLGGGMFAYANLTRQEVEVAKMKERLDGMKNELSVADAFVGRVSFAQAWHAGDPRYLTCVRDLTNAIPDDGATYATSLVIREAARPGAQGASPPASTAARKTDVHALSGLLYGKTSDQQHVQIVLDRMKQNPAFTAVKLGGTQDAGRGRDVSFSINFDYRPAKP